MKKLKDEQVFLLKEILNEVKDVKKEEKNNRFHLARHSKIMVYLQGVVKKLWDKYELEEIEEKSKDKITIQKLKKLLITLITAICLLALGINNIPEAILKLSSLI